MRCYSKIFRPFAVPNLIQNDGFEKFKPEISFSKFVINHLFHFFRTKENRSKNGKHFKDNRSVFFLPVQVFRTENDRKLSFHIEMRGSETEGAKYRRDKLKRHPQFDIIAFFLVATHMAGKQEICDVFAVRFCVTTATPKKIHQ